MLGPSFTIFPSPRALKIAFSSANLKRRNFLTLFILEVTRQNAPNYGLNTREKIISGPDFSCGGCRESPAGCASARPSFRRGLIGSCFPMVTIG
jgi:hypothetical protein